MPDAAAGGEVSQDERVTNRAIGLGLLTVASGVDYIFRAHGSAAAASPPGGDAETR